MQPIYYKNYDKIIKIISSSTEIPEELKKYYRSSTIPHITVSIGEVDGVKGKPVDTAKLDFKPLTASEVKLDTT